jgi:hypothetical protein
MLILIPVPQLLALFARARDGDAEAQAEMERQHAVLAEKRQRLRWGSAEARYFVSTLADPYLRRH